MMTRNLLLIAFGIATIGCTLSYNPRYSFNQVQAVNLTSATITNVSIDVIDSPWNLDCDEVVKFYVCADRFPKRLYPNQGISLSWTHTDGSRKSETLAPSVPVTFNSAFGLRIVMEINDDGSVKAFYEQDDPNGRIYY